MSLDLLKGAYFNFLSMAKVLYVEHRTHKLSPLNMNAKDCKLFKKQSSTVSSCDELSLLVLQYFANK